MSDSSDRQQAVRENGREHRTKATIEAIAAKLDSKSRHDEEQFRKNDETHTRIEEFMDDVKLTMETSFESVRGKIDKHRMIAVVAWAIFVFFAGHILNRAEKVFDRLADRVEQIGERTLIHESEGMELGRRLKEQDEEIKTTHEHDVDELRGDMKQLRRRARQEE